MPTEDDYANSESETIATPEQAAEAEQAGRRRGVTRVMNQNFRNSELDQNSISAQVPTGATKLTELWTTTAARGTTGLYVAPEA